jgi:hypothetical protein
MYLRPRNWGITDEIASKLDCNIKLIKFKRIIFLWIILTY